MGGYKDLTGQRFGNLTVLGRTGDTNHGEAHWLCLCDCGNTHIAMSYNLTHGRSHQCHKCAMQQVAKSNTKYSKEPIQLFYAYTNMKTRCSNPKYELYHRYGGRGIKVCKEWDRSFSDFRKWALANGYRDGLTLDRIDNDGDYEPSNCRWTTKTEQANNRRTNRILVVNGEADTMANWSRRMNLPYWVIQRRVDKKKWNDTKAVMTPWKKTRFSTKTQETKSESTKM